MREKKQVGEHSWGQTCRRKRSLRKRSEDEEKVLRRIKNLLCVVSKMSSIGRSGIRSKLEDRSATGGVVHARMDE